MLLNFQDGKVIVMNFVSINILYVSSRIEVEVEMLFTGGDAL